MFCLWILSGCYWQLLQQVNTLTSTVDSLNATINAQAQLIAQLNQTIQELKEQLNKNSQNSSKPPSSDGFKKPAPKSLRKPSGKKAGGQRSHRGTSVCNNSSGWNRQAYAILMRMMPALSVMQKYCMYRRETPGYWCGRYSQCNASGIGTSNLHAAWRYRRGDFPSDVKAAVQYGENLQALAVALNTIGAVSANAPLRFFPEYLTFRSQQERSAAW